jgi:phosphoglycerate dehydrogenase-like enzyme
VQKRVKVCTASGVHVLSIPGYIIGQIIGCECRVRPQRHLLALSHPCSPTPRSRSRPLTTVYQNIHTSVTITRTHGRWPRRDELALNPDKSADLRKFGTLGLINLRGKTVGMLGYGHIARETARLLQAFGCEILAANTAGKKSKCDGYIIEGTGDVEGECGDRSWGGAERMAERGSTVWRLTPGNIPTAWYSTQDAASFDTFLSRSEILVASLPSTPATRGMLTREHLARLPPRALFINVGRGDLVSSDAILAALDAEGGLLGAGLDVTDPEPLPEGHALLTHPRAVITPHSSADFEGYFDAGGELLVENIENMRRGGEPFNVVDPEKGY